MGWTSTAVREATPAEFAAAVEGFARSRNPDGDSRPEMEAAFAAGMAIRAQEYLAGLTDE